MKQKTDIKIEVPDGHNLKKVETGQLVKFKGGSEMFIRVHFEEAKPAKKVIDLSCIVGSGIDCEFFSPPKKAIYAGKLSDFDNDYGHYFTENGYAFDRCRIRQSPHVHCAIETTSCPIPEGLQVRLFELVGGLVMTRATTNYWGFHWGNVVAFEVLGVAETHRHEWEEE